MRSEWNEERDAMRLISVGDSSDVELWALVLGSTPDDIVAAVSRVGNRAADVQAELIRRKPPQ
ncbi:hypothetical protein ACVWWJ_004479 [Luteibacter sp. HA06]